MLTIWKNLFLEVRDKHAPLQHKKIRSNKVPWMTSDIKKLINTMQGTILNEKPF